MSKHRSLSNALLTPEKLAFIKPEGAAPGRRTTEVNVTRSQSLAKDATIEMSREPQSQLPEPPRFPQSSDVAEFEVPTNMPRPADDDYLVAVTTRLQARTAEALRRAYLEQKLNRKEPGTQQEIIEAALQAWLRRNAFLR